jgi:hypothetical protein
VIDDFDDRLDALLDLERDDEGDAAAAAKMAGGHVMQLAVLLTILASTLKNIVLQCSRRAGKTWVCLCILLLIARRTSGVTCLYLGLTKVAAQEQWRVWLRMLSELGISGNHVGMSTTLSNGSRIEFGGLDDLRHVQGLRGKNLSGGCAILDESQSDPGVMETTVVDILGPMLDEQVEGRPPGLLVLAGTIPELEGVGYFERMWAKAQEQDSSWVPFNWGRRDNPHEQNFEQNLVRYCKKYGFDVEHPHVQRTWFGRRVFGDAVTAYGWTPKNSYIPVPPAWLPGIADAFTPGHIMAAMLPPGARYLSLGVDPGTSDTASVEGWAFGAPAAGVWHVFEWITPKHADTSQGDWAAVLGEAKRRYSGVTLLQPFYDAGGSNEVIDTFQRDYGISAVLPARKSARKEQVDRFKTLLRREEAHVMAGSSMEYDLQNTRWDLAARDKGKWEFSAMHHPGGSESGRYALDHYFNTPGLPERPVYATEILAAAAAAKAAHDKRFSDKRPQPMARRKPDIWGKGWRPR